MNSENLKGSPTGYFVVVPGTTEAEDDLDLPGLLRKLWLGRWWIALAVIIAAAVAALHAFTMTPIYRSEALLAVRSTDEGPLALLGGGGQLGGLASLAGLGLGSDSNRRTEYLAFLESNELAREFIEANGLMQVFYAEQWNETSKTFEPNWLGRTPTLGDAVDVLLNIRTVRDDRSGLVTVSFEWRDPAVAAEWVTAYVALANERLRQEAIETAQQSLEHLNAQLEKTSAEPVRQSLFRLMEGRLNEVMVASVEREYAFKVIDRAEAPDKHRFVRPMRLLEILLGVVLGFGLGAVFSIWKYPKESDGHAAA